MSKMIDIRVTTFTAELNLLIPPKSTGRSVFDKIALTLGLQETWFFGIVYVDVNGFHRWLKMDKKVNKIKVKDKKLMKFNFLVKYYPEDVTEELIQNLTISLFYFQIRENILRGDIFCPPETALLLASLSCQVKFGDYDPVIHKQGFFLEDRILPDRILKQYHWSMSQWEETLMKWYQEHSGMFPEEAMLEYLKLAQDLEMYGVSYFLIINKKGSSLYLGIDAMGLNIYKYSDKLTPQIGFPWSEIRNISFTDTKFWIKSKDKNAPDFVFYTQEQKVNKNILAICSGNHELSVRRRKGDSIVVKQMKNQALIDKIAKSLERERLLNEKKSREEAQRRLQVMEKEFEKKRMELASANRVIESCLDNCDDIFKKLEDDVGCQNNQGVEKESVNDNKIECATMVEKMDIKMDSIPENFEIPKRRVTFTSVPYSCVKETKEYDHDMSKLKSDTQNECTSHRRMTVIEKNTTYKSLLTYLGNELRNVKIPKPIDELDSIHETNKAHGMNKFQTLKQIRLGNTKKRVEAFESL